MTEEVGQQFQGWAEVELFGHCVERGYVKTLYFGNQAMFEIEQPRIPEREVILLDGAAFGGEWLYVGTRVKKSEIPAKYRIVGSAAVYAINPKTEDWIIATVGGEGPIKEVVSKAEYKEERDGIPF